MAYDGIPPTLLVQKQWSIRTLIIFPHYWNLLTMNKLSHIRKIILFIVGSLSIVTIQKFTLRNLSSSPDQATLSVMHETRDYSPMLSKKMPLMGFRNLAANYTFIQFLLYFGNDEARQSQGYGASAAFFETIIHRDPYFKDFYFFLSQSMSVYAGIPDTAIEIMNEGSTNLAPNHPPDGYHVWRYKGIDELLFALDSQAAQHSFEMAAAWAAQSSEPDSQVIGARSQRTAQFLSTNPDSRHAQISAWSSILISALDDEIRANAVEKIRELGGDVVFSENGGVTVKYAQSNQLPEDSDS